MSGVVGPIFDDIGETYQRVLWQDSGITAPESATPEISAPEIEAPETAAAEPMSDAQLQSLVDINNHEAEVAAYDAAGMDIGPPGDTGMDFTPSDAPIVAEDYEPQGMEADPGPEISGPEIGADIGPSEGPDMG